MEKQVAARVVRRAGAGVGAVTLVAGVADAAMGHRNDQFKQPKLRHGTLTVKGTGADDKIALRLAAGQPDTLEVEGNGTVFDFKRARVADIVVDAAGGDDIVGVDDSNGAFPDTIPT